MGGVVGEGEWTIIVLSCCVSCCRKRLSGSSLRLKMTSNDTLGGATGANCFLFYYMKGISDYIRACLTIWNHQQMFGRSGVFVGVK